jgi:hypothetical protein
MQLSQRKHLQISNSKVQLIGNQTCKKYRHLKTQKQQKIIFAVERVITQNLSTYPHKK